MTGLGGLGCTTAVIAVFGFVIALQLILDAVIRNVRDTHNAEWIKEGQPLAMFSRESALRPIGDFTRLRLHRRLLFNAPDWAKRDAQLHRLMILFRALHVGLVAYIALIFFIDFLLRFLYPTP